METKLQQAQNELDALIMHLNYLTNRYDNANSTGEQRFLKIALDEVNRSIAETTQEINNREYAVNA